jgi:hypothetical protein
LESGDSRIACSGRACDEDESCERCCRCGAHRTFRFRHKSVTPSRAFSLAIEHAFV